MTTAGLFGWRYVRLSGTVRSSIHDVSGYWFGVGFGLLGIGLFTEVAMSVVGALRVASSISGGWPTLGVVFSFASSRGGGHGLAFMVHGLAYGFGAARQALAERWDSNTRIYLSGCLFHLSGVRKK